MRLTIFYFLKITGGTVCKPQKVGIGLKFKKNLYRSI